MLHQWNIYFRSYCSRYAAKNIFTMKEDLPEEVKIFISLGQWIQFINLYESEETVLILLVHVAKRTSIIFF